MSILAGIFIGLGAIVYINVGGIAGAFLFSVGLLAVLCFKAALFTGKAGLLSERLISFESLCSIWAGNFCGTFLITLCARISPKCIEVTQNIVNTKIENGIINNFILGIPCGILMYIAVKGFKEEQPIYTILSVMVFILSGFNHCVADMAYCHIAQNGYLTLIPTTIGNLIGCNIIPLFFRK